MQVPEPDEDDELPQDVELCHACNTRFDATTAAAASIASLKVSLIHKHISIGFKEVLAAQGVRMARCPIPNFVDILQQQINADAADPLAAASLQHSQLVQEELSRPRPLCPGCVKKRSIWGQLVATHAAA